MRRLLSALSTPVRIAWNSSNVRTLSMHAKRFRAHECFWTVCALERIRDSRIWLQREAVLEEIA
jgi:hypothetical protein